MKQLTTDELAQQRTDLSSVRSHLANERTFLSLLRTGIALISFGITLNRFSLFLIQSEKMAVDQGHMFLHDTKNIGIGMVVLGSVLLIWSTYHFLSTAEQIDSLDFKPSKWSLVVFTLLVIVMGTVMTGWMMLS